MNCARKCIMSNEWFYIQQWNRSSKKIWTVIDQDVCFCIPEHELVERVIAAEHAEKLKSNCKNKNCTYYVIHNQSRLYEEAKEKIRRKNEN